MTEAGTDLLTSVGVLLLDITEAERAIVSAILHCQGPLLVDDLFPGFRHESEEYTVLQSLRERVSRRTLN